MYNKKEKKIIFYIDYMDNGGAQRVMSVLANYLDNQGYKVILVNDFKPIAYEYPISSNIKRLFLRENNAGNPIIKNIQRIKNLRRFTKKYSPDVVLSFLGRPNKRMLIATIGVHCKKIVSVRNDPNKEYGKSYLKKILANCLFCLADGCVFQTEDASRYFWKRIRKKSKIIFNPVDDKFYKMPNTKSRKSIITVGRLEPQKNHKLLIDAYEQCLKGNIEDDLFIYGDGKLRKELEDYVEEKGIGSHVHFEGVVANIEEKLNEARLFILSSDYEGMPNSLMEAMASGVAVISTNCPCGGPKTLIQNENQGILVPCNNKDAMTRAMEKVLNGKYLDMGKNARERAEDFKTDKIVKIWEEYLFK